MASSQPQYYTVDDRPVMVVAQDGREAAYVYDDTNGNFRPDPRYVELVSGASGRDVVQVASSRFEELLAVCRAKLLHRWCEQMSKLKGTAAELAAMFGDGKTVPLPLSSEKVEIKPDEDLFSTVVLRLPPGVLKRWQVEQVFGSGTEVQRVNDAFPHRFRYPVVADGARYLCALYVSTPAGAAGLDANVITLALNQERNRSN